MKTSASGLLYLELITLIDMTCLDLEHEAGQAQLGDGSTVRCKSDKMEKVKKQQKEHLQKKVFEVQEPGRPEQQLVSILSLWLSAKVQAEIMNNNGHII